MPAVSKGAAGEVLAARFLRDKGYTVVAANYRSRFGEIDIIACDQKYIAFVEVKTRSENALFLPREAVTEGKQRKILKTALFYLQSFPTQLQPRFDVIEILTATADPMKILEIDHIISAYETEGLHAAF